jgi:NAD+ kinase
VGIVVKPMSDEASAVAQDISAFLQGKGVETFPFTGVADGVRRGKAERRTDLLVVVGGDGTVMRTAQRSADVPILGVKVGALGFLCETTPDRATVSLEKILAGESFLEFKTKFKVGYGGKKLPDVLNEALVCTSKPSKILSLMVVKDGEPLHKGKADGVIVSTATGSTAYALSAGGPIIDTQLDIMEVIFICPLAAGLRPLVLPASAKVEITVLPDAASGMLVLDGQLALDLDFGSPVTVERSDKNAVFLRVNKPDFYRRVREKTKTGFEV